MKEDFEKCLITAFLHGKGRIAAGHEGYALLVSHREAKQVAESLEKQGLFRTDEIELEPKAQEADRVLQRAAASGREESI